MTSINPLFLFLNDTKIELRRLNFNAAEVLTQVLQKRQISDFIGLLVGFGVFFFLPAG